MSDPVTCEFCEQKLEREDAEKAWGRGEDDFVWAHPECKEAN